MNLELSDVQIQSSKLEKRNPKCALWLALIVASAAVSARAQVGAVNQVDNSNTRQQLNQTAESQLAGTNSVPQLYDGETSDVGPQSVVMTPVRHTLFQARADVQLLYTDNAFLTANNKIGTGLLISTAEFALAPTPYPLGNGTLAPRIGYKSQWFDYFFNDQQVRFIGPAQLPPGKELSDFNFNSQSVYGDATWTHGHLSFGAGLEADRLFSTPNYDPFYDELLPYWSARFVLPVCDKSALSATYLGDYRFTSVEQNFFFGTAANSDVNNRTDHALLVSWTQVLNKHLVFQPFYQFKYTRFANPLVFFNGIEQVNTTRNDYLNTVGAGIYWLVCPNFTVRGFVNYNSLKSNISAAEYREFDGGGGLDVTIRF
jgi:hypothetical protein